MFVFTIRVLTKFKIAQNYIVGIQIKLVREILSEDLKPLVRNCVVLGYSWVRWCSFVCACIRK